MNTPRSKEAWSYRDFYVFLVFARREATKQSRRYMKLPRLFEARNDDAKVSFDPICLARSFFPELSTAIKITAAARVTKPVSAHWVTVTSESRNRYR